MSSKYHQPEETIRNPHALTDRDLYDMPLRDISRKLSLTTSVRTTIEVYLRWLEVHRTRPSDKTKSWNNLVWQWGQSLRQRGIRESELIRAVRAWKDENGPFPESEREPPGTKDIQKAFDTAALPSRNKSEDLVWKRADPTTHEPAARRQDHRSLHPERATRVERERGKDDEEIRHSAGVHPDRLARVERELEGDVRHDRRERVTSYENTKSNHYSSTKKPGLDSYMKPPPSNYICNRCHKGGHHLQACPTNMNPDFDLPPDRSYVCSICQETGTHYKSLCPLNPDPFSIIQRRHDAGYVTGLKVGKSLNSSTDPRKLEELNKVRNYDRACRSSPRDSDSKNGSLYGSTPPSDRKQEQKERLRKIDEMRGRLSREEIDEVVDSGYAGIGELGFSSRRKRSFSYASEKSPYPQSPTTPIRKKNRNTVEEPPQELVNSNTWDQVEELLLAERGPPRGPIHAPRTPQMNPDEMQVDDDSQHSSNPIPIRQKSQTFLTALPAEEKAEDYKMIDTSKAVDGLLLKSPSPPPAYRRNPDEMVLDNDSQDSTDISVYYSASTSRAESTAVLENPKEPPRVYEGQLSSPEKTNAVIDDKVPPKIYSDFIKRLILKNPEMNTIRNPIKRRPHAYEMWEQDSRRQKATREFSRREKRIISQFDGPCDEIPIEVSNRRRKNKLADLGKDTFGRVKGVAKEFPKLRSRSKARPLTNQTEPLISRSATPPSPCPKDDENSFPQRPPNIPRVMVTSLPSNFREKELPKLPDTKKLSMQVSGSWTDTNSSTGLDESKLLNHNSKSRSQPDFSTRWDSRRSIHNSSVFSRRSSSREGALSESRSTNEFRSTVRKIIEESKSEEPIRSQSQDNLKLPATPRANFLRTMSASPETPTDNMNGGRMPEMIQIRKGVHIKQAICPLKREDLDNMAAAKNATRREKTINDLKTFAGTFKLGTPIPKDIAELVKLGEHKGGENGAQNGEKGVEMRL